MCTNLALFTRLSIYFLRVSVCVLALLVIRRANRIFSASYCIWSEAFLTLSYFRALYHKRHGFRNTSMLNIKFVFLFSLLYLSETFLFLRTIQLGIITSLGTAVAQWLGYCATNWKVAGSIPAGVNGIFFWHKILPIAQWPWGRRSL